MLIVQFRALLNAGAGPKSQPKLSLVPYLSELSLYSPELFYSGRTYKHLTRARNTGMCVLLSHLLTEEQ